MDFKINKSDIWFLVLFFGIAILISFGDFTTYESYKLLILETLTYVVMSFSAVYAIVFVGFPNYFPQRKYVQGFFMILGTLLLLGAINGNILLAIGSWQNLEMWTWLPAYYGFTGLVSDIGIICTLMLGKKLFEAQVQFLQMEKEKKESELRFLKSQIDPHFLFNNLNTVDSLIDSDPTKAKIYLNKLSTLYRYLISTKDDEVVPLEDELAFAENYQYLIETRYGKAYQFEIKNEAAQSDSFLIPPGALQALLENIVKHNKASHEAPVKSTILIKDDVIEVSNNLNLKTEKVDSHGIGMNNLKTRYKLLTDKEVEVIKDDRFTVRMPVIKEVN